MDFILGILTGVVLCMAYGNYLLRQRKKEAGRSLDNLKKAWMDAAKITPEDMQYLYSKPPVFPLSKAHAKDLDSQIQAAIQREDFEEAARLRDLINKK
jgi:excinuclease UvrABC helicase subunit UvrB